LSPLVLGAAIVNRTTYPGTGELKVSFPVWARAMAQAIGDEILQDLRDDPRVDGRNRRQYTYRS
jgi:small conductance mechanosensitive channel